MGRADEVKNIEEDALRDARLRPLLPLALLPPLSAVSICSFGRRTPAMNRRQQLPQQLRIARAVTNRPRGVGSAFARAPGIDELFSS